YSENEGEVFLGRTFGSQKNVSEATQQQVDAEIRRILDQQYGVARAVIESHRAEIEAMAAALLEWETIDANQIDDIMAGRPARPPKPTGGTQPPATPPDASSGATPVEKSSTQAVAPQTS
ncbi:MAG: cell division protein FtsH, partial [Ferrovum sp.]|nr:cell division protein FtsH [Ferrovum sp.]